MGAHIRADTGGEALPGAIVPIQKAGNFLNWHPHLHVLATAGAFTVDDHFLRVSHVDGSLVVRTPADCRRMLKMKIDGI